MKVATARRLRLRKGVAVRDVSAELGIHDTILSNFEKGPLTLPRKWHELLAKFLGVKVGEIIDENGFSVKEP